MFKTNWVGWDLLCVIEERADIYGIYRRMSARQHRIIDKNVPYFTYSLAFLTEMCYIISYFSILLSNPVFCTYYESKETRFTAYIFR